MAVNINGNEILEDAKFLDLSNNQLTSLPKEIGQLKNLEVLDLRQNNFSEKEKEKTTSLLPNCKIYF